MSDLTPGAPRPEHWTDKDSKDPTYRELYEGAGYVEAYARHTDIRAERNGPEGAIGRVDEWETHGDLQLEFLRSRGLTPTSTLLDIGCGSGRFARRAVPFLDTSHYIGIDISEAVLAHAQQLSIEEGWAERLPVFLQGDGTLRKVWELGREIDMVWAHSVLTHLPERLVLDLFADLSWRDFGQFLFTYKHANQPRRSGLKQFQYPASWFIEKAEAVGMRAEALPDVFPAGQRTMRVWRP